MNLTIRTTRKTWPKCRAKKIYAAKLGATLRRDSEWVPSLQRSRTLKARAARCLQYAADLSDSCTWYWKKVNPQAPAGPDLDLGRN